MDIGPTVRTLGTIVTIVAAVGAGAKYIGEGIWKMATAQTEMISHLRGAETAITGLTKGLATEHDDAGKAAKAALDTAEKAAQANTDLAADLAKGRKENLPRIDALEKLIPPLQSDVADLKKLATENLRVSNDHTKQLNKVLPQPGPGN